MSGEVYNIVSDVDLQYNSRFVFLDRGACPVVNGVRQKGCYSHPGSYLGELGLKTSAGDHIHVVSGQANYGFVAVTVNGRAVHVGSTVLLAEGLGSISRNSTHLASVQIGDWEFEFENSDMFINQKVRVANVDKLRSHGMLGQTWRKTTYPNAIRHIQGQLISSELTTSTAALALARNFQICPHAPVARRLTLIPSDSILFFFFRHCGRLHRPRWRHLWRRFRLQRFQLKQQRLFSQSSAFSQRPRRLLSAS